jgi:hypothetical protein
MVGDDTDHLYSKQGDALFKTGKFDDAKTKYWELAVGLVGPGFRIPGIAGVGEGGVRSDLYTGMDHYDRANLMGCCSGIAKCLIREGNIESVRPTPKLLTLQPHICIGPRLARRSFSSLSEYVFLLRCSIIWRAFMRGFERVWTDCAQIGSISISISPNSLSGVS